MPSVFLSDETEAMEASVIRSKGEYPGEPGSAATLRSEGETFVACETGARSPAAFRLPSRYRYGARRPLYQAYIIVAGPPRLSPFSSAVLPSGTIGPLRRIPVR